MKKQPNQYSDKFTEKQEKFLEYLFSKFPQITDKTYEEAKIFAGYSESTPLSQIVANLRDEIIDRTKQNIAMYGPEAFGEQLKLMRNPKDKWWRAKLSITDSILDRVGIIEKHDDNSKIMPIGIIILDEKKPLCGESET